MTVVTERSNQMIDLSDIICKASEANGVQYVDIELKLKQRVQRGDECVLRAIADFATAHGLEPCITDLRTESSTSLTSFGPELSITEKMELRLYKPRTSLD